MKLELGKYNDLRLLRFSSEGDAILDGGEEGELVLSRVHVREWMKKGQPVHVFTYVNRDGDVCVTRQKPLLMAGTFAYVEVMESFEDGVIVDGGIDGEEVFIPAEEIRYSMSVGKQYVVYGYLDGDGRLQASNRIDDWFDKTQPPYHPGDAVHVLVYSASDLGFSCIIDNRYQGILYADEIVQNVEVGAQGDAYIKRIRDDFKIDLSQTKIGFGRVEDFADVLLQELKVRGGVIGLGDGSSANAIYDMFGVSKKTFKKAVGTLYRNRLITPYPDRVVLN